MSDEIPEAREAALPRTKALSKRCGSFEEFIAEYELLERVTADLRAKLADVEAERVRVHNGMMDAIEKRTEFAGLLHAAIARAEAAENTLRNITPSLLDGRGCWTGEEIERAVFAKHKERDELRRKVAALKAQHL